jgi:hypothetical protein
MSKTQNILDKIKYHKGLIKVLKDNLVILTIHPGCNYRVSEKLHARLLEKGWIVFEYMIEKEGYFGFGMSFCKHEDEMTDWDWKLWNKHQGVVT